MNARALLDRYALTPKKSLGQNFLTNPDTLAQIADAAALLPADTVLEIGPGLGHLTRVLAQRADRVLAVEIDARMLPVLTQELSPFPHVHIIQGDILLLDPAALIAPATHYKVVANIPYYITAPILRHLLEARVRPQTIVVTVQAEVAERLAAQPDEMSLLAVSVQFYGRVELIAHVKAGAFYPSPEVDSAVVRVNLAAPPPAAANVHEAEIPAFFRVVKAGFSQRRKQLKNTLVSGLGHPAAHVLAALERAAVTPTRRAETLTLAEWVAVYSALRA